MPDAVFDIELCPALHQHPHHRTVAGMRRLMQRRAMRMRPFRVVAVGIFAGIEQERDDVRMPELSRQNQRAVPRGPVRRREQTRRFCRPSQSRRGGQIDPRPAPLSSSARAISTALGGVFWR